MLGGWLALVDSFELTYGGVTLALTLSKHWFRSLLTVPLLTAIKLQAAGLLLMRSGAGAHAHNDQRLSRVNPCPHEDIALLAQVFFVTTRRVL